jgi:catechol 2,3-dioxygenase-like lactoylglutathione lyase family enzyme
VTLQHVALETRREDAAAEVAFWALLGFEEVEPPESLRGRAAWVQDGPAQIHVLFAEDPVVVPRGHVAVIAAGYDATVAALEAAGHAVEPRRPHWGARRAYTHTPAGHLVELMAAPPPRVSPGAA